MEWVLGGRRLSLDELDEMRSRIDAWWLPERERLVSSLVASLSRTSPASGRDTSFYACRTPADAARLLREACLSDDIHALRVSLENGADVDLQFDGAGSMNPLEAAMKSKSRNVSSALISVCEPTAMTSDCKPLLLMAAGELDDGDPAFEILRERCHPFTDEYTRFMAEIAARDAAKNDARGASGREDKQGNPP